MKQGTMSVLFGCHSPIHSLLIVVSWYILYKRLPKLWEVVCIFLHDIGHIGTNYLDNIEEKNDHWIRGASIAYHLFGIEGYLLIAGHDKGSGFEESLLLKPDKYSRYIAPLWLLYFHTLVEPKLARGRNRLKDVRRFQAQVKESIESGKFRSTHNLYLEREEEEN